MNTGKTRSAAYPSPVLSGPRAILNAGPTPHRDRKERCLSGHR
jgi:hypothetical protein